MRKLLLVILLLLVPCVAWGQALPQTDLDVLQLDAYTNERISVADTPVGLNAAKVNDVNVSLVTVKAKGGTIIWTRTGQNPTTSYGNECVVGCVLRLSPAQGILLLMIREDTTKTVTAIVEYYAPKGTTPIP